MIPVRSFPNCDWIFFYSPRAIQYFLEQKTIDKDKIRNYKIGTMGVYSSQYLLEKTDCQANFTGEGSPSKIAHDFTVELGSEKVLIPRALNSLQRIENHISKEQCFSIPVYQNHIDESQIPPETSHALLTSPLNARAYFEKIQPKNTEFFCLGETTQNFLKEEYGMDSKLIKYSELNKLFERRI